MLDLKFVVENINDVQKMLEARNMDSSHLTQIKELDTRRKQLIQSAEELRARRNVLSKEFGRLKKEGQDITAKQEEIKQLKVELEQKEQELEKVETEINSILYSLPNILDTDTPIGKDENDNVFIRKWDSSKAKIDFKALDHVDIGEKLGIIDIKRAGKVTGARFNFMVGDGARLERALINFMLDVHTKEHGYKEVLPPFIVNSDSMFGTGQLPKFKEDLFKLEGLDYFLIPTAEVPVTNYRRNEIIDIKELPIKYVAYTPCFRSEAGSYGKDTRGIIRQHQFNKVELVKIVHPDKSKEEHEALTKDAEHILQLLGLDYRVVSLCSGDIGFGAAKCYDLEVFLPSQNQYREISSCSNYLDFQARRAKIRYKNPQTGKNEFLHTINGSGLAVGRTLIAILEQYQLRDGRVQVPEKLVPYFGKEIIG